MYRILLCLKGLVASHSHPIRTARNHHAHNVQDSAVPPLCARRLSRWADTDADRRPLDQSKTTIEATLSDDRGTEACHGVGQPSSGDRDGTWVLVPGGESGYWHWRCSNIPVQWNATYTWGDSSDGRRNEGRGGCGDLQDSRRRSGTTLEVFSDSIQTSGNGGQLLINAETGSWRRMDVVELE